MRLDSLATRIRLLEHSGGFVVLDDGSRFRPDGSGIHMMFNHIKLRRDLGREPELSDFPKKDRDDWRNYAKWNPDPGEHGQISQLVTEMAKKLVIS